MEENFYHRIERIVSEWNIKGIVVLGKGFSARKVSQKILDEYVVININDSEIIYPGEFAFVHRDWVIESVKAQNFSSGYYISDKPIEEVKENIVVPYFPFGENSMELIMQKFSSKDLFITDYLFVSAIKLCLLIAEITEKKALDVYFLGFDFEISGSNDGAINTDSDDLDFKKVFLKTQESYFRQILNYFNKREDAVNLVHIGEKPYSSITIADFQRDAEIDISRILKGYDRFNTEYYEELKQKTDNGYTIVVAELTNNHAGDPERLRNMVRLAKDAGADLIKVQKREVESFYTPEELDSPYDSPFGKTLRDYRMAVEMGRDMFELLIEECYKHEIGWFSTVLDYPSYDFIDQYDCPLIKVPSTISNHRNFISSIAETSLKDIVVSTGYTDKEYQDFILEKFGELNRTLWLLQCTSSYPTPPEACQVGVVRYYDKLGDQYPNIIAEYSSHDVGSHGSMLAVGAGAKMVEKHVKLGNLDWIHFDGVALDLYNDEYKKYVSDLRKAELMCGDGNKRVHPEEHHKYTPNHKHN